MVKQFKELTRKRFWEFILMKNLSWSYHVNNVIQSSYATLRSRFTPYKVRKSLAETLIISKIRYCLVVNSQLPKHQIQRQQKLNIGLLTMFYNISHKLLRPSQFLEKCMEILEWSTLQR